MLALATRVRFETPYGFTVPTQLAFVPLIFSMPVTLVPIATVIGLRSVSPSAWWGELRPIRFVHVVGNAWFAIGPVAVFVIAGSAAGCGPRPLLVAALAAQFALRFLAVSLMRDLTKRGTPASPGDP